MEKLIVIFGFLTTVISVLPFFFLENLYSTAFVQPVLTKRDGNPTATFYYKENHIGKDTPCMKTVIYSNAIKLLKAPIFFIALNFSNSAP